MGLPSAGAAVHCLGAVDEMKVHPRLALVKERFEVGIDEVDRSSFSVGDTADRDDRAEQDPVIQEGGQAVAVREFRLIPMSCDSGLCRSGQADRAKELTSAQGNRDIPFEAE